MSHSNSLVLNREQSRKVDEIAIEKFGIPGIVLMENAGRGCAEFIVGLKVRRVVILCGSGNNGGDGFVIARHLSNLGVQCKVIVCCQTERISGDALTNFQICRNSGLELVIAETDWTAADFEREFSTMNEKSSDLIVDCLLGTGSSGDPRPPVDQAILAANSFSAIRVAVDLPSGLDCDKGACGSPTFLADHTLTLVAQKSGFQTESAKRVLGELTVVGIGIPSGVLDCL